MQYHVASLGRVDRSGHGDKEIGGEEAHGLTFGPASSFAQLCEAFRLVYREYLKCGYQPPHPCGMRFTALQLLPHSRTFVATLGGGVVGTGTMVVASRAGLPSSDVFGDLYASLACQGRLVVEGTLLACIDRGEVRAHSVSLGLMRHGIAWAMARGADDWCVVVNPKHFRFWNESLGLEVLGESRPCEFVRSHPGILLRLPLRELREGTADASPLLARVLEAPPAEGSGFSISDAEVAALLVQANLLENLSPAERAELRAHHPVALSLAAQCAAGMQLTLAA